GCDAGAARRGARAGRPRSARARAPTSPRSWARPPARGRAACAGAEPGTAPAPDPPAGEGPARPPRRGGPESPRAPTPPPGRRAHEVVEGDDLGADEAALDVGMGLARRLLRARAAPDGPGPALVLARGQEGDEAQQLVGGPDHAVEAGLVQAEVLAEGRRVLGAPLPHPRLAGRGPG